MGYNLVFKTIVNEIFEKKFHLQMKDILLFDNMIIFTCHIPKSKITSDFKRLLLYE